MFCKVRTMLRKIILIIFRLVYCRVSAPRKSFFKIAGAKYAQNSHILVIV